MRPYFAILKDSFREAFASKLLLILLILITLILAGVAGFRVESAKTHRLSRADLLDPERLINELLEGAESGQKTPASAIYARLPEDVVTRMKEFSNEDTGPGRQVRTIERLVNKLNDEMDSADFVDAESWKGVALSDEVRDFRDGETDELPQEEIARLNRLALDAAFPESIRSMRGSAVSFYWWGLTITENQPLTMKQVQTQFTDSILVTILNGLLGFIGVLLAILVTASIIPRTFEPGEIDLLLSKPVARPLLFLTKFLGGCAFITLLSGYFIFGFWVLIGWRLDMWMPRLLLCIPVLVFVFAVLYSVSTFVGVIWRNSILCVVMTMCFWFGCWAMSVTKEVFDGILYGERVDLIVDVDGSPWIGRKTGQVSGWDDSNSDWDSAFNAVPSGNPIVSGFIYPLVGPTYDAKNERLIAVRFDQGGGFGFFRGGGQLVLASKEDGWEPVDGAQAASTVRNLFLNPDGDITVVGVNGIERFEGDPKQNSKPFVIGGFDIADYVKKPEQGQFVPVYEPVPKWQPPFDAMPDSDGDRVAVVSGAKLIVLTRNVESGESGEYEVTSETDRDSEEPALVAINADHVLVARNDGAIELRDVETLEVQKELKPSWESKPKQIYLSSDGSYGAVLFHNRKLWMMDVGAQDSLKVRARGQGDISAVLFTGENTLWASDRFGRVTAYSLPDFSRTDDYTPSAETLELVYRYGIDPIYTIFPKPGQLDNLVRYIITGDDTQAVNSNQMDLRQERAALDVWQPIWSNLAFMACMLGLSCYRVWRKDF